MTTPDPADAILALDEVAGACIALSVALRALRSGDLTVHSSELQAAVAGYLKHGPPAAQRLHEWAAAASAAEVSTPAGPN